MMMSVFNVVHSADSILEQLGDYINLLDQELYTKKSEIFPAGTAGKHIRHTLDHFKAAIMTAPTDVIDYDHRERGVSVEESTEAAVNEIAQLRSALSDMNEGQLNTEMTTQVMCSCDGQCAELGTTRAREVFFALHHAIHHNAILKAIATEFGVKLPDGFGTAPSTINYEQSGSA